MKRRGRHNSEMEMEMEINQFALGEKGPDRSFIDAWESEPSVESISTIGTSRTSPTISAIPIEKNTVMVIGLFSSQISIKQRLRFNKLLWNTRIMLSFNNKRQSSYFYPMECLKSYPTQQALNLPPRFKITSDKSTNSCCKHFNV